MGTLVSTSIVEQKDRFSYWREAVCDTYVQLDCNCDNPAQFGGEILLNRMSRLSTSFVSGSQQLVRRRKQDISQSNEESFLISLQLANDGVVQQSGRTAYLKPGDFTLYSSTECYSINLPDGFRQLVVQVPREELLSRLPRADLLTGITISGKNTLGSIVNDSVLRLVNSIEQLSDPVRQSVQDTIIDLFLTGLASLEETKYELSKPEEQILLRGDAIIHSNLYNPVFDRQMLAAQMGMSVRRLSEIYQNDKRSISSTIRNMRLSKIAADLKDSRYSRRTISDIAYKWGIANQQRLIRNFKAQYGLTPREFRQRR